MNRFIFAAMVVLFALVTCEAHGARFVPLGKLPGTDASQAEDVSADGSIVVGTHSGAKAFRWTEASGMTYIGDGPGGLETTYANAISGDGQTIVGVYVGGHPFKWTKAGGVEPIAPRLSPPVAASFDGSIITGGVNLQFPVGGTITDASWDGSIVVGHANNEGFRIKDGAMTWMGDLPGSQFLSVTNAVSPDGTIAVGSSRTSLNVGGQLIETELPFRWTESEGMVALGPWHRGQAWDISRSNLVIVGRGKATLTPEDEAFRWTPAKGMESIQDLLLAQGVSLPAGWILSEATAVSANGRIVVGQAGIPQQGPQAWLAELDIPGDFDADGDSDGNDFLNWQRGLGSAMDADDFSDWLANINFYIGLQPPTATATSVVVPEPTSSIAAAIGLLALTAIRQRCAA